MTNQNGSLPAAPQLAALAATPEKLLAMRIKHTRIAQMMDELDTLIYPGSQDSILLVCGPTGVGKTTLGTHMVEQAQRNAKSQMEKDAGFTPAIFVEAPASGEAEFSWRLFYHRILGQTDDDGGAPKMAYGVDSVTGRLVRPRGSGGNSLAALRTAVTRSLRARGTQYVVIDEAAHIFSQSSAKSLKIQLDTLKSLANDCGAQMVMVGSYDLYQLMSLSGQLARRTHVLHFERYRQDCDEDLRAFRACVQKFEDALPALWGNRLLEHADALHENTLGCIGTLSAVLTRAAVLAMRQGGWSVDALRRALLTEAQRLRILEEILEGEAAINPGLTRTLARAKSQSKQRDGRSVA